MERTGEAEPAGRLAAGRWALATLATAAALERSAGKPSSMPRRASRALWLSQTFFDRTMETSSNTASGPTGLPAIQAARSTAAAGRPSRSGTSCT